jgi:hypothetical protein
MACVRFFMPDMEFPLKNNNFAAGLGIAHNEV